MTKLGWFEDEGYRTIVDDGKKFLDRGTAEGSQGHYFLGLKILNMLVQVRVGVCRGVLGCVCWYRGV